MIRSSYIVRDAAWRIRTRLISDACGLSLSRTATAARRSLATTAMSRNSGVRNVATQPAASDDNNIADLIQVLSTRFIIDRSVETSDIDTFSIPMATCMPSTSENECARQAALKVLNVCDFQGRTP
jgi:hypothetical protein